MIFVTDYYTKILCRIVEDFPQLGDMQLKTSVVRQPRLCLSFLLLLEYKLSQHQLRFPIPVSLTSIVPKWKNQ
jgi:hypothetical protein